MLVLFPSNPIRPKSVDASFDEEARAAEAAGFHIGRIDLEILRGGEVKLSGIDPEYGGILYRGWLMKPEAYARMQQALPEAHLITDVTRYRAAYELPQWYQRLQNEDASVTPRTIVLPIEEWGKFENLDGVAERVSRAFGESEDIKRRRQEFADWQAKNGPFGHPPIDLLELPGTHAVILKDFVKSAKHRWYDACFIHHADNKDDVKRVVKNFLDIVGDNLVGGLCFRKFEHFERIGVHSKTKQPLVNEWRAFMSHGKVFYMAPYWAEGNYSGQRPDQARIEEMCKQLDWLPFIAVDVAEKSDSDGNWMVVEVNDGGAAGVPEGGNTEAFFKALRGVFPA